MVPVIAANPHNPLRPAPGKTQTSPDFDEESCAIMVSQWLIRLSTAPTFVRRIKSYEPCLLITTTTRQGSHDIEIEETLGLTAWKPNIEATEVVFVVSRKATKLA
ncbi:MAG: hypothetical protein ISR47_07690 [Rhodospirillales bacterium]|nr:hypothetical protein [Rhodospirillales bacterium]